METLIGKGDLLAIYTDPDDTARFTCGYLMGMDQAYVLIASVDTDGAFEDMQMIAKDSIYLIEKDDAYLNSLKKEIDVPYGSDINDDRDLASQVFEHCINSRIKVEIELLDSGNIDVSGYITEADGEYLQVDRTDDDGTLDGTAGVRKAAVSRLTIKG